jgi:hypothetical protein
MSNNRHTFNLNDPSRVLASARTKSRNIDLAKSAFVKSNLVFRSTADLNKSRCSAYSYLIP